MIDNLPNGQQTLLLYKSTTWRDSVRSTMMLLSLFFTVYSETFVRADVTDFIVMSSAIQWSSGETRIIKHMGKTDVL